MKTQARGLTIFLVALLAVPLAVIADDGGSHDGAGGGSVSDGSRGGNHDQNRGGGDGGQQAVSNQNAPGGPQSQDGDAQDGNGQNGDAQNGAVQNANAEPQRTRLDLAATDAGNAIGATGHADLRAQGNEQRLTVEMEANVPDGTMFTLVANGIPIGTITVELGVGEFQFEAEDGQMLTGGLTPAAITSLALTDSSNTVVLQAQFGALSSGNPGLPPVLAIRKDLKLTSSALGVSVSAQGDADLRSTGAETRLKVEVEAKIPDGTVWTVLANGNVPLGGLSFRLMEAELHLDATALAQAGLTDASSITSIQVNDASGNEVLAGIF